MNRELYSVQVGALKNRQGAQTLTDRLKKKHYDAFIKIEEKAGQDILYRVLVGRFAEKSGAEKTARTVTEKRKNGVDHLQALRCSKGGPLKEDKGLSGFFCRYPAYA